MYLKRRWAVKGSVCLGEEAEVRRGAFANTFYEITLFKPCNSLQIFLANH